MLGMADIEGDDRLGRVQSLVRAFGLLDALAKHDEGLTLTELAKLGGLPRSTAHRLLTTMDALRYVEFDSSSNRWMIGVQGFALGSAFVQTRDLGRLGRPIMRSLMIEANEVVNIAVSESEGIRYVGQVRPVDQRASACQPGTHLPMHTTASGKVLLAHWDPAELDHFLQGRALARRTYSSIVEKAALVQQLGQIRSQGFAIDNEENSTGMRCVAAPVFDRNNRVRASLSISGSCGRLPDQRFHTLGRSLAAAARRMSEDIGAVLAA
jgi:IclR family transcriptional regulator, acetate operon repressor